MLIISFKKVRRHRQYLNKLEEQYINVYSQQHYRKIYIIISYRLLVQHSTYFSTTSFLIMHSYCISLSKLYSLSNFLNIILSFSLRTHNTTYSMNIITMSTLHILWHALPCRCAQYTFLRYASYRCIVSTRDRRPGIWHNAIISRWTDTPYSRRLLQWFLYIGHWVNLDSHD